METIETNLYNHYCTPVLNREAMIQKALTQPLAVKEKDYTPREKRNEKTDCSTKIQSQKAFFI